MVIKKQKWLKRIILILLFSLFLLMIGCKNIVEDEKICLSQEEAQSLVFDGAYNHCIIFQGGEVTDSQWGNSQCQQLKLDCENTNNDWEIRSQIATPDLECYNKLFSGICYVG